MSLEDTLKERGGQHGKFADNAQMTDDFDRLVRTGPNYSRLSCIQKVALYIILHKVSRVVCGDPNHTDHWHDIGGYAKLAEDEAKTKGVHGQIRPQANCPNCGSVIPLTVPGGQCPVCKHQLV